MKDNASLKKNSGICPILEMKGICKYFGGVHALEDVDFELYSNEILALVGDNGAGKSTLIKVLSGAHPATEGTIYFEGKKVEINNPKEAKEIGIETVYQDLALAENLDIAANLFLGREFKRSGLGKLLRMIDKKKMWQKAKEVMKSLEIVVGSVKTPVENLSGGQRQAVAIGKTVYLRPKVIIMDEPTANISVKEKSKVLELMQRLKREGPSFIFISHNLQEVFSVVDRVVVLNRGEKVGDEKIENITMLLLAAIESASKVGLKLNVEKDNLDNVLALLPAEKSPTVSSLADSDFVAIEVIIEDRIERSVVPALKRAGASGIITYPLNKVIH